MYTTDLLDMPIEVFGGYNPALMPTVVPPGASPSTQDCDFPEGGVTTRGGLFAIFGPANGIPSTATINGLKTYLTPTINHQLMVWDSAGNLYGEGPDGTLTLLQVRPQGANTLYQSTTLFGREYQAFFGYASPLLGLDIPRQWDGMNWDRVSESGPGAAPAAVESATAGNITAGKHQVTVSFINRQGFITQYAPSPTTWTATGTKQVALSAIATGPPNIIARLILFTPVITAPATTGSFYSLPTGTTQLATPTMMLINDNVTTTLTVDFTDVILIAGFQANYLATERVLGEPSFVFGYNARLGWMGERTQQQNFVNLMFDGGFTASVPASTSAGPNSPTAASSSGPPAWSNPTNVFALDGIVSSSLVPAGPSGQLKASGYGFAIPSNATINGIQVVAQVAASVAGNISDDIVQLTRAGILVGSNHQNGNLWGTVIGPQTYGSSLDLWGTTWTPADINNVGFGVAIVAFNNGSGTVTAKIDYISIKVFYTTPTAGAVIPLGWTAGASNAGGGSALTNGFTADWGDAYAITGDGATAERGQITQTAYQDYLLAPLIARNTSYRVRARVASAGGLTQGTLHINLQSTSGTFTTPGLAVQASQTKTTYQEFDGLLTTAIISPPTDLLLQVYADGTPNNNGVFLVDSIEIYPASVPYNYSTAWLSHAFNPESYDNTTSQIQVRPNDGQVLRAGFSLRSNYYLAKDHYLCYVTDDGINEPASWQVNEVSSTVGICGPNAWDATEEWAVFAERSGLYIFWGADPVKITPEIQQDASLTGKLNWNSINWTASQSIWVRIDKVNKQILVGVPMGASTLPNTIFMLDYKWLDNAQDIASSPMVTYSAFTGKVLAHGRGRRWMLWNIAAASMAFVERSDGTVQPFYGNSVGNGKVYWQKPAQAQASDDGVAINSFYSTYYSPSHVEEQVVQLGVHRKLLGYLKWRAFGSGVLAIAITTAQRTTNLRGYILGSSPTGDGERSLNLHGERFSITVQTNAVGSWFRLEQLIPCLKKDATIVVRGTNA